MITFITLIAAIILAVIVTVVAILGGGAMAVVAFADVIVFVGIVVGIIWIAKKLFNRF